MQNVDASGKVGQVTMGAGLPYAGWIEFGGGRGHPYRPRGRYLYPTAKRTEPGVPSSTAETRDRAQQIRRMRWPTPR